jgi:hypothetical protein
LPNKPERTLGLLVAGALLSLRLAVDSPSKREMLALHPAAKRAHAAPRANNEERELKENG